jgi:hypothetical protein
MTSMLSTNMPELHTLERTMPLTSADRMLFDSFKPPKSPARGLGSVFALVDIVFEDATGDTPA